MKKVFKNLAPILLSTAMTLSGITAFADFSDMPTDETATALTNAVNNGLLTGYETGEIKPYDNITRAQMAAIIVRALGATEKADISSFGDVNSDQWFYDSMSKAVYMGAFKGDGANLNPEANITFQEAFAVISRIFNLQTIQTVDTIKLSAKVITELPTYGTTALDAYADKDSVAAWAKDSTLAILEGKYFEPTDNLIKATEYINRTEFAILMDNLVKTYINEPGTYKDLPAGNVMIRTDNATVEGITGDVDIFVGDGVKDGVVTKDCDVDRVIIRGGNVKVTGTYNQVRMIGHKCTVDISEVTKINIQCYGEYADSSFFIGTKEM